MNDDVQLPVVHLAGSRFKVELLCRRSEVCDEIVAGLQSLGVEVIPACDHPSDLRIPLVRVLEEGIVPPADTIPFVVVAASRSAEGYVFAIESGASGYFIRPLEPLSLGAALLATVNRQSAGRTARFGATLTADQTISTVVGMLMERLRASRADAYARLKRHSRDERRKLADVATEMIQASEKLTGTLQSIALISMDRSGHKP